MFTLVVLIAAHPCFGGEVVDLLIQRNAIVTSLNGEFRQERHISVLSLPLISTGTFSYQKRDGVVWKTLTPVAGTVQVSPGQNVTLIDASGNRREAASSQLLAEIFLGVFSGNLQQISSMFIVAEESDASGWQLRLTPRNKSLADYLESINLSGSEYVESIHFIEGNGDSTDISLRVQDAVTGDRQDP